MPTTSTPDPEAVRQGATVRAIRELRGLRVGELAALVPHSPGYQSNIEAGKAALTPKLVTRYAELLGVRPIALVRPDLFPAEDEVSTVEATA